jgi:hypothetical protein
MLHHRLMRRPYISAGFDLRKKWNRRLHTCGRSLRAQLQHARLLRRTNASPDPGATNVPLINPKTRRETLGSPWDERPVTGNQGVRGFKFPQLHKRNRV